MTLNADQTLAADNIFQFLLSDQKYYKLSGPGGTGKTFLMNHIMTELLPLYERTCDLMGIKPVPYQIALTATTNKAAEVLQNLSKFPAETVHSFMHLTIKDNYKTGVSEIKRTNQWCVHQNKLIFIDEASMISTELERYIREGTDNSCKIIYVGDHCQLAPVFETVSPIYRDTSTEFTELTQLMRNAGQPALMSLCRQLRHTVQTGEFFHMEEVPGVIDYLTGDQALELIDTNFKLENTNSRILAYSNRRVQEYNSHIRELRGYSTLFEAGEQLINNSGFQLGGGTLLRPEESVFVLKADHTPRTRIFDASEVDFYTLDLCRGTFSEHNQASHQVQIPFNAQHVQDLSNYFARNKDWYNLFALRDAFPDLRQKDASTVHKAQGSTYDFVLIDLKNIGTCTQIEQTARMLYVAVSRPTQRIYFYGGLPPKYEGIPAPQPF